MQTTLQYHAKPGTSLAVAGRANGAANGAAIDTAGWDSLIAILSIGDKTDGSIAVGIEHSDASGSGFVAMSSPYDVAFTAVGDGAAGAGTVQRSTIELKHKDHKRYIRFVATVASNAAAANCPFGIEHVLFGPRDCAAMANTGWDKNLPTPP